MFPPLNFADQSKTTDSVVLISGNCGPIQSLLNVSRMRAIQLFGVSKFLETPITRISV